MPTRSPTPWRFVDKWVRGERGETGEIVDANGDMVANIGRALRNGNWRITAQDRVNAAAIIEAVNEEE